MRLFFSSWIRDLDRRAIEEIGIPSQVLMENAAGKAAGVICREFSPSVFPHCLILCGKGNNGGDGLALARILHDRGFQPEVLLTSSPKELSPDALLNFKILQRLSIPWRRINDSSGFESILSRSHPDDSFLVDALFGTGLKEPLRPGIYGELVEMINRSILRVVSLDIPSGLSDSFLPDQGISVHADLTVSFAGMKWALIHPDGNLSCGKIHVADIGIPCSLYSDFPFQFSLIEPAWFPELLAPRPLDGHKGTFGHVLALAGSPEKPGAGLLCAFSALKTGAGLVTAAVPEENRLLYVEKHPELMTVPYGSPGEICADLSSYSCILAGPGLGVNDTTAGLVERLLNCSSVPLVLDADALNVLNLGWLKRRKVPVLVLTPHPGEFSRMTGLDHREILDNRPGVARDFAMSHQVYLVLKGHHSVLATPSGDLYVNQTGNPGMATAGSGDVLTGMIAAMISQYFPKIPLEKEIGAALFFHGYAGDIARRRTGEKALTANDIVAAIADSLERSNEFRSAFQFSG